MENQEYEISFGELFDILKNRWIMIVAITASTTIIAGVISFFMLTPIFETSTTMLISYKQNQDAVMSYNDVVMSQKLVNTYSEIIKSRRVSDLVIEELDLNMSPDEIASMVTVSPVGDTEIIKVAVQSEDPEFATEIANTVSEVFQNEIKEIMEVDSVATIDEAFTPENPIKPNKMMNIIIGGMLGLMGSIGLAFLLAFMDRTMKTTQDIERHLGLPLIGAIPDLALESDN